MASEAGSRGLINQAKMKKVETALGELHFLSKNMVKGITTKSRVEDLEEVKAQMAVIEGELGAGFYYLSDSRQVKQTSKGIRKYLAQNAKISALAILAKSSIMPMLANMFINFSKPPFPTKILKQEADAIAWLVEQGAEAP